MSYKEIFDELARRAADADGFYQYCCGNDDMVLEMLDACREADGDGYRRADAYRRYIVIEAYAYDRAHEGSTMWRAFA